MGFLSLAGPLSTATVCRAGEPCKIKVIGFAVSVGDKLQVHPGACGDVSASPRFPALEHLSFNLTDRNGLEADLGALPADAVLGSFQLCWCPATEECSDPSMFMAPAGELQIHCQPGYYKQDSLKGPHCSLCPQGWTCPGQG